jgi:Tfp pilus assembly protein PilF
LSSSKTLLGDTLNFIFYPAVCCLFFCSLLSAQVASQDVPASPYSVSVYQLRHKPVKEARRFCDAATVELKKEHYSAGLELLQQALSIDPDYWVAQNNLGFALLHLHRHVEAQKAFQRAVEIDPHNPLGYANLSVVALGMNNFLLAEKAAAQSMRLNPQMPEARAMLGLALAGQGNWTPQVRKLLEESRAVPTSQALLKKWPAGSSRGPAVTVYSSDVF